MKRAIAVAVLALGLLAIASWAKGPSDHQRCLDALSVPRTERVHDLAPAIWCN